MQCLVYMHDIPGPMPNFNHIFGKIMLFMWEQIYEIDLLVVFWRCIYYFTKWCVIQQCSIPEILAINSSPRNSIKRIPRTGKDMVCCYVIIHAIKYRRSCIFYVS